MHSIIVLAGCILSFLCGAYVRSPFVITRLSQKKKDEKQAEDDTLDRQWENFWNYDGKEK